MSERMKRRGEIAARLAGLIKGDPLTHQQIADKMGRKAKSAVSGWASGHSQPSLEMLADLLEHYGRSADWLLGLGGQDEHSSEVAEPAEDYNSAVAARAQISQHVEEIRDRLAKLEKIFEDATRRRAPAPENERTIRPI